MQTFYFTDVGKVRSHNEDNVTIISNDNNEFILAVADGMGGHRAGEVASGIAIDKVCDEFYKLDTLGTKEDAIDFLRNLVQVISKSIFAYTKEHPESKGMGTTLVIAIKTNDYILYGNIGDSSGYVLKNGELYKVTRDHTLVNLLISTGELTEEEAKFHPRKNVTNMLTDEQIVKILNSDLSIEEAVVKLIRKCNSRGGTDNVSIAYLKKEIGDL